MKFRFENFGYFDQAELELGELTLICGSNNVGKTYLNYAIYGFLERLQFGFGGLDIDRSLLKAGMEQGRLQLDFKQCEPQLAESLNDYSDWYASILDNVFSSPVGTFEKAKIQCLQDGLLPLDYSEAMEDTLQANGVNIHFQKNPHESMAEITVEAEEINGQTVGVLGNFIRRQILKLFLNKKWRKPFVITAERTGIALFQKELDLSKNVIIEKLTSVKKNNTDPYSIFPSVLEEMISRYPISVKNNIDLIRDLENIRKKKSHFFESEQANNQQVKQLLKTMTQMLNGSFQQVNGDTYFVPRKERKRSKVDPLPMYMSSSSVKSLLLLDAYIKHLASPRDILIIDEPELNLHPRNQIWMARLLAQLVNAGIHVLITTHSDFLVKEFNHLLMLSQSFPDREKLMKRLEYSEAEVLKSHQVKAYIATEQHTLEQAVIDERGIQLDSFDTVILDQGDVTDAISFALDSP